MYKFENIIRVRYGETDRMGYVYNGNYASYFEVGRAESLRNLGISYKKIEDEGFALPVRDMKMRFFKPAYYDEALKIVTTVREKPGIRICFEYEIFNESQALLTKGDTTLVFVNKKTGKPDQPPAYVVRAFEPFFD